MPIGNQLMRARVGTYNFSRKVLKPKIFSSGENNFYTVHFLSTIMTYLILMLYYFLSICLVISGIINMQMLRIFKKLFQCLIGTKHLRIKIHMK